MRLNDKLRVNGSGLVRFNVYDGDGNLVETRDETNTFTMDMAIVIAAMISGTARNEVNMMVVGDGALGNPNAPDAATQTQRAIGNELDRKAVSVTFLDPSDSSTVAYPTKVVRFSATFGAGEGTGAINEIALMSAVSALETASNPNAIQAYDADPDNFVYADTSSYDLITNYLTFAPLNKQADWSVTLSWTVTFEVG
jgi:hypothetical protein